MNICMGILIVFMLTVLIRTFARQVLVKRLGMDNIFTQTILFDNNVLQNKNCQREGREAEVDIDWREYYPFDNELSVSSAENKKVTFIENFEDTIATVTNNIDVYTSDFLIGYDTWIKIHEYYHLMLHWTLNTEDGMEGEVIFTMDNGYLTYKVDKLTDNERIEIANSVEDFNSFLYENKIPFYYINAGSKVNPNDRQLSGVSLLEENTNENGDALLAELDKRNINNIDMRQLMMDDKLDWYSSYYITDHHWTTDTGLWCSSKIAEVLNDNGFDYDLSLFEPSSFERTVYNDFWFGGQATGKKLVGCKRETYVRILPTFETYFEVNIPTQRYNESGNYDEVLFDEKSFSGIQDYSDEDFLSNISPYNCIRWTNDALGTIKNNTTQHNADKNILIIQDSFGWYSATFLACQTGEVDLIYPSEFNGSIRKYIEDTKPDAVIVMYCEKNIKPINWSNHESFFDFR